MEDLKLDLIDRSIIQNPKTIVLFSDALIKKDASIDDIGYNSFKITRKIICETELILFISHNGQTKILKNKWGNPGIVK